MRRSSIIRLGARKLSSYDTPMLTLLRSAAAARNCMHGLRYNANDDGTGVVVFRILYKERVK